MFPTIVIDDSKCLGPIDCGNCLRICPMMVFIAGPTKVWKFRESDNKDYQVYARYFDQCITCYKCVDGCPGEAISVSIDSPKNAESAETASAEVEA